MNNLISGKTILITGGTGSFGKAFVKELLKNHHPKAIRILSRDELKQWEMQQQLKKHPNFKLLRFFIGDVRDSNRLYRACEDTDIVIHAAALKQVPAAEYNPIECIKTNVLGAENVVNASIDAGVKNVVALSTDKASSPINLYGATKLCSDKLFTAASNIAGNRKITFSVVRYGNVMGSRGSVIPFFISKRPEGVLPVTHPNMTRFNITLEGAVQLVLLALQNSFGGEIFVPKIPSYRILDLAKAVGPECKIENIGIRPGEKLHEEMIAETDSLNTVEFNNYYVIIPSTPRFKPEDITKKFNGQMVRPGFKYSSDTNKDWLTVDQIRSLIKKHVDPNFTV